MSCDEWKAFLQDYVTGGLSEPARAAIDRHLSECAACFAEARAHKLVEGHLRSQAVLDVPPGLVDRIVDAAMPARLSGFRRELLRMAAVVLAAVGLGTAFVVGGFQDRLPAEELQAARRSLEASIQSALNVTQYFQR